MSTYNFGKVQLTVNGLGLFTGEDKVRELVSLLSHEELKKANREAWKLRRSAGEVLNRCANFTIHGSTNYDSASLDYRVAKVVAVETWKLLNK